MEVDLAWLKAVIARHCPALYIHPADKYMPCSVEWFMQHSALCMRNPDGSLRTLVPRGGLAGAVLLQFQVDFPNEFLWIEIDSEARLGQAQDPLNSVPVYACVKAVLSPHEVTKVEALEINYLTFFAYNGSYTVAGLIETGHHDGDWEHWTARIHPRSGELLGAWYNAHRGRDGEWVPASAVPRTPSGRPIAYVALHGHGNYPRTGTIYRHFFLGNDRCSDDGPVWLPDKVVLLPNHSAGTPPTASKQGAVVVDSVESAKVQEGEDVSLPVAIHACRSRGCSIDVELAEAQRQLGEVSDGHSRAPEGPDVVIDDPCEWLFFKGNWGTTCAPINQRWLHDAETPTSRSSLQRIFFHLWPETESV